ncbi:DNA cytosine methyltransferase [Patescibacteria group bacterium]|nr:MAG: DNA cytosine methyltransferase [Patescibacteria group bacterium]
MRKGANELKSVELFTGAGGLAMGLELAGFQHEALIEWDHDSCETIRENQRRGFALVRDWKIYEGDARAFDYKNIYSPVHLVAGGPPCQPFSLAGKHGGFNDSRDMWGEAVRAVRELRPQAFIFENVKGLLRSTFSDYFKYVLAQLANPSLTKERKSSWIKHSLRLRTEGQPEYIVQYKLLNAADYGVPQKRERVFIVGFRADLGIDWKFPEPTHVGKWVTVRQAISDLPAVSPKKPRSNVSNHLFQAGAKFYKGHTGSKLDLPAKTLKAGTHGVPGGENMLVDDKGHCRYFSVREAARLQCFPDGYVFPVSWSESMRQLGNAVPVQLGKVVGQSVAAVLKKSAATDPRVMSEFYDGRKKLQPA